VFLYISLHFSALHMDRCDRAGCSDEDGEPHVGQCRGEERGRRASGPRGSGRRRVELGHPDTWVRDDLGTSARAPMAGTAAEQWVALYTSDGTLVGAASRWCPHRRADLLDHAEYHACPGAISCRHAGYSWWIESGYIRTCGDAGPAASIEIHEIRLDDDGSAYIILEQPRGGLR
jgi:hypothetical protein